MRAWLADLFSGLAERLDGGRSAGDPYAGWAPISDQNVGRVPTGAGGTAAPMTATAQMQSNAMRVTPYLAVAVSCLMIFGLVRFWRSIGAKHDAPSVSPQDVARKFEDAYRFHDVKREADADAGADAASASGPRYTPAPQTGYVLAPSSRMSSPFPQGQQVSYPEPRFSSPRSAVYSVSRVATFYDPVSDIIRNLTPPVDGSSDGIPGTDGDSRQSGPVWREGVDR